MKKINIIPNLEIILFVFMMLFFAPSAYSNDEISEELLETPQKDEIVLNIEPQTEEVQTDEASENAEVEFELFKKLDEPKPIEEAQEESLFGKILHSKITRTDVPSYLLQDDLTFEFQKGPFSKIQPWLAYRGGLQASWLSSKYSTTYENFENQIGMYGSFRNPNFKFQLTFNPIHKQGTNYLERFFADAFIVNTSIPNHQIVLGNSRINTGIEGGKSSYILPFVTRSQIARNYGNYRSLGAKVIGNYQYVDYNLFVGSGGRSIISGFPGAEFNSWINFKPFGDKSQKYGKLIIGGGYNHGHNRTDYNIGSVYVSYNHKRLWTNFEAAIANGSNGSTGISTNKSCGWAYTLGWKFNPHLQLIGRIDQFDPDRNKSHDLKREYTIGINWFIKGQALKVVLNYVFCDNQNSKDSHKIILATQILI